MIQDTVNDLLEQHEDSKDVLTMFLTFNLIELNQVEVIKSNIKKI